MKKSLLWVITMLMAFSFALAGCGSSNGTKSASGTASGGSGGSGKKQNTLVFGRGSDSVYLDPARATDGESFMVTKNIFETLVNFSYQKQSTAIVNTGLAKSWKISPNGLKYTFKLRKGIKFTDGTPFNAKAVVFNFHRWKNVKKNDQVQFPYYPSMFGGYGNKSIIKSVTALNPYTVQFTLKRPSAPFLKDLAMSPFAIASPTAVKKWGANFTKHPVGTGPFKFVQWKPNDTITLVKNKNYWKKGYPKLSRVIFKVIKSNRARLTALENGEIDLMNGLDPNDIPEVKGKQNLQIFYRPPLNVGYLGMTVTRKPFGNVKVRQAINYAINKKAIVKAFYSPKAKVAAGPLPATIPGHDPSLKPYPYNPKKAKKLLAEAGYPNGFSMQLWAMPVPRPYMPDGKKIAQAIQADLAKVGIKAKIVQYDWSTYLQKTSKGEADAFLLGWTGDNGTADNFLYTLLSTAAIGGNNYTQYSNKKLDKILVQAQQETDPKKRVKMYQHAEQIIHKTAPWVPLVHSTPALAGSAKIADFKPNPTGSDRLTYVYFK